MHWKCALGILKKSVELRTRHRTGRTFASSQRPCDGCARVAGGRWKSQNRKNMYLSHVKELLNSMVIKSFVPELRSRKCFSCFGIPMFYIYIYIYMLQTFYVRFTYPYHGYGTQTHKSSLTFLSHNLDIQVECYHTPEAWILQALWDYVVHWRKVWMCFVLNFFLNPATEYFRIKRIREKIFQLP